MACPICDNKPANCDCTTKEREQFDEIESLRAEISRLREDKLTQDERTALRLGRVALSALAWELGERNMEQRYQHFHNAAETLKGLLVRNGYE
jgi:hypothetical protein